MNNRFRSHLLKYFKFVGVHQVEQAKAGMEALTSSEKTINKIRENFVQIEKYGVHGNNYSLFLTFLLSCKC